MHAAPRGDRLNRSRILLLGQRGMVGSAIQRRLHADGLAVINGANTDLRDRAAVDWVFSNSAPDYVFLCAARVGGILANSTRPAEFVYDNLMIQANVIDAAYRAGVKKLLFLGSSCIYPRDAEQPIKESALMTGPLEPTNEAYAVAKIAGIQMCQAYRKQYGLNAICAMPTNLYGPGDNFRDDQAHVIPAMIRKFHEAKLAGAPSVTLWGTGNARREFLHVDDMADAAVFLMEHYDESGPINVGGRTELTICELAKTVAATVEYGGRIEFDASNPDGPPRKQIDSSRLRALGWIPEIPLTIGLKNTYQAFLATQAVAA